MTKLLLMKCHFLLKGNIKTKIRICFIVLNLCCYCFAYSEWEYCLRFRIVKSIKINKEIIIYIYTYIYTYRDACMHAYTLHTYVHIHTFIHTCIHTRRHIAYTYIRTAYTHTHTHTHIQIHILNLCLYQKKCVHAWIRTCTYVHMLVNIYIYIYIYIRA